MSQNTGMLHRRPRASTLVLLALFGGMFALYVIVRPDTVDTSGGNQQPSQPTVSTPTRSPSPSATPSDTAAPTPTSSSTATDSATPTPTDVQPTPSGRHSVRQTAGVR